MKEFDKKTYGTGVNIKVNIILFISVFDYTWVSIFREIELSIFGQFLGCHIGQDTVVLPLYHPADGHKHLFRWY